ncbi:hypothetical protein A0H76_809 [Hepatospora eriocheir]|uniref:Uncharacterized protein n=1 Tax=Hepatospora eriocheir TaxID=1081669 RepID=A0A1X0Q6N5_9MICR|nr:hypothetical protein A0H76_809 [Hepatospora eriocheir]
MLLRLVSHLMKIIYKTTEEKVNYNKNYVRIPIKLLNTFNYRIFMFKKIKGASNEWLTSDYTGQITLSQYELFDTQIQNEQLKKEKIDIKNKPNDEKKNNGFFRRKQ